MKKFILKIIPVLIGLGLAAVLIFSYINYFPGAFSPEDAVTGYIKASMTEDVNNMLKFASDYQKTSLYGNKEFSNSKLRKMLTKLYAEQEDLYSDKKITFTIELVSPLDPASNEYADFKDEYQYMTGNTDFSKVTMITLKVFVDGKQKQKSTVFAVKSGLRWYYGY